MKTFLKILFLLFFLLIGLIYWQYPRLNIISGFAAKNMCSCMFEAFRTQEFIEETDNNFPPMDIAKYDVDTIEKTVIASVFGFMKRKAIYREDLGCQLLIDDEKLEKITSEFPAPHNCPPEAPYPYGNMPQKDTVFVNIDYTKLNNAVENAFDPKGIDNLKTRSLMVIYKDQIIAEKYDENFDETSVILGWSMSKSVLATLFGILEKQGEIGLDDNHLFPEWETDERSNITLNNLLQMQSGLEWEEDYSKISDVTKMLFLEKDMSSVQKSKPLQYKIGTHWNYSSGTSNLLSNYLRNQFDSNQEYLDFPVKQLYDKLGMRSMFTELDIDGNYVASSYTWGNTGHWGKLGLLYLHKGNWNGNQILNESWVKYVSTPCENSKERYGAHFWLNAGGQYPDVPKDMYSMNGYQGQMVFIIPSKNMVIVRMGLSEEPTIDFNKILHEIINSIDS